MRVSPKTLVSQQQTIGVTAVHGGATTLPYLLHRGLPHLVQQQGSSVSLPSSRRLSHTGHTSPLDSWINLCLGSLFQSCSLLPQILGRYRSRNGVDIRKVRSLTGLHNLLSSLITREDKWPVALVYDTSLSQSASLHL